MAMPFLSIVIPFCDRDWRYITSLLRLIDGRVKVSHEVILVDNREKYKNALIKTDKAKILTKGRNVRQFEARRLAVKFCRGKYVWFVDADDSPGDVSSDLSSVDADVIVFSSCWCSDGIPLGAGQEFAARERRFGGMRFCRYDSGDMTDDELFSLCGRQLWNKWISTSLLNRVLPSLPVNAGEIAFEDSLLCEIVFSAASCWCFCDDLIYVYSLSRSHYSSFTYDNFRHIMLGYDAYNMYKRTLIPGRKYAGRMSDCGFFLNRLCLLPDGDRSAAMKKTLEFFTFDEICMTMKYEHEWIDDVRRKTVSSVLISLGLAPAEFLRGDSKSRLCLSLVLVAADRNWQDVPRILELIEYNISVPHENVVIDIRNDRTPVILDWPKNCAVYRSYCGSDVRVTAAMRCRGRNIWIVPMDDTSDLTMQYLESNIDVTETVNE